MSAVLVDVGSVSAAALVAVVRAQDPAPPPGQGPEFGEASPIALVVVILLGVALIFLIRSMTKHLKKVPASFDPPTERPSSDARTSATGRSVTGRSAPGRSAAETTADGARTDSAETAERADRTD